MVCLGGEVPGVGPRPEAPQPDVQIGPARGVEGVCEPVADPLEHGHIDGHPGEVLGCGVHAQLLCPEAEAGGVDLVGRPIAQLEVEDRLPDIDGCLANLVPGGCGRRQRRLHVWEAGRSRAVSARGLPPVDRKHLQRARELYARRGAAGSCWRALSLHAHLCADRGRRRRDALPALCCLQPDGGAAVGIGLPIACYALGRTIPSIDRYLLPAITVIVVTRWPRSAGRPSWFAATLASPAHVAYLATDLCPIGRRCPSAATKGLQLVEAPTGWPRPPGPGSRRRT
jgi:hypothetical protein